MNTEAAERAAKRDNRNSASKGGAEAQIGFADIGLVFELRL